MTVPNRAEKKFSRSGTSVEPGPYEAVVMNNQDSLFTGRLQVWISHFGGKPSDSNTWTTVRCATPYYGITPYTATKKITNTMSGSEFHAGEGEFTSGYNDSANALKDTRSFGMWTPPPEIGTKVLVTFANYDHECGYWFAAVPEVAHGMIPALGAGGSGAPEAEFDPSSNEVLNAQDVRKVSRPALDDVATTFSTQGLTADTTRGYITSSSLRESPSKVMGFNTPGNHSFVMDDGNSSGKSKLIRLRTAAGNQITMHDDTGMVYITNASGSGWLELSPSGQIDVFGAAGINLASTGDINLHASKNVNIHAGENLKMVAGKGAKLQGTEELQLHGKKTMIEGVDSVHIHSCNEVTITSFKDVFMKAFNWMVVQGKCFRWNTGTAKEAEQVPPEKPTTVSGYETTVARAPSHEPYKEHDNGSASSAATTASAATAAAAPTDNPLTTTANLVVNSLTNAVTGLFANATRATSTTLSSSTTATTPATTATAAAVTNTDVAAAITTAPTPLLTTSPVTTQGNAQVPAPTTLSTLDSAQGIATQALGALSNLDPASSIPAGAGGGNTGFAKGNNCERPADTSGGQPGSGKQSNVPQTNYKADSPEGKAAAEKYLGRSMSDQEYSELVAATAAESGSNQTEQAWVSGTILNRARSTGQSVSQVLRQSGQFESVTGPAGPSSTFINGPGARASSINGSMTNLLSSVPTNNYYFDAANPAAYKYGSMPTNRGGVAPTQIGASRFYAGASWP